MIPLISVSPGAMALLSSGDSMREAVCLSGCILQWLSGEDVCLGMQKSSFCHKTTLITGVEYQAAVFSLLLSAHNLGEWKKLTSCVIYFKTDWVALTLERGWQRGTVC